MKHTLIGTIAETGVQSVDNLVEDGSRHLLALVVKEPNLDRPLALRETLNLGWLIAVSDKNIKVSPCAHIISLMLQCMQGSCKW
jgi:hypothetical protein